MDTIAIIELIALILVGLGILTLFVIKGIKNNWISQLIETLKQAVKDAEKTYGPGQGVLKLDYVLSCLKHKCEELGIPYKLLEKALKSIINKLIEGYNTIVK